MGKRYSVCVDFDGVIHSYSSPWISPEEIPDPPVPGAIDWLNRIGRDFDVVIHTTRARTGIGRDAVRAWLLRQGYGGATEAQITDRKVPALVYIDDRAWRFTGTFPTAQDIHDARPWNKPVGPVA